MRGADVLLVDGASRSTSPTGCAVWPHPHPPSLGDTVWVGVSAGTNSEGHVATNNQNGQITGERFFYTQG
jgi:hypothetical protein